MSAWLTWNASPWAWVATAAVVVAGVVSARHYAASPTPARLAASLRAVALGLLLLTAWQPTLRFVERSTKPRPLYAVVDDSLSMGMVDAGRSAAEWLRVAAALGRYDGAKLSGALRDAERLRAALAELRQADEAATASRPAGPTSIGAAQRAARDAAATAADGLLISADRAGCAAETVVALRGLVTAIGEGIDPAAAARVLDETAADIRRQALAEDEEVAADDPDAVVAIRTTQGQTRFDLAAAATARLRAAHGAAVHVSTVDGRDGLQGPPSAAATPLTASLREACSRAASDGADGVVLISDGRSTESRSLLPSVAASGVPVFAVAVAPDDRSPDVRVVRVEARPAVLAGQPLVVRVRLGQRNTAAQSVRIVLSDGTNDVARVVQLGGENTFDLTWPATTTPEVKLTARVDSVDGETRTGNNADTADAAVLNQRQRVLVLAADGGRDVRELTAALAAAAWVDLKRPAIKPGQGAAIDAATWAWADLIVLANLPADALDEPAWADLTRAVRGGGGSLLVLPGDGKWLREPAVGGRLAALLPTTPGPRPDWVTRPSEVTPVPTRFGTEAAYLRLDGSADASLRAWLGRPRLSRVLSAGPPSAGARALLVDRSTQIPLLIEAAAGGGRVALMLTDEVWRWSTDADADAARRFWLGLADALYDMPYGITRDGLSISPDRPSASAGRAIGLRCRVADPAAGAVTLSISKNGVSLAPPALHELLPGGGRYQATLSLAPGTFEIALRQGERVARTTLVVTADAQLELADTTPDAASLTRIADATGGAMLSLDDVDRLPDLIARRRDRTERVAIYAVWSSPYWFAAIVACMGLEWAMRPRAGLA